MSNYQICMNCYCVSVDSDRCPLCKKPLSSVDEEIDNPFDRKIRFRTGVVRIGKPYRFEKPLSELAYNFIVSLGFSSLIIYVIADFVNPTYWIAAAICGVIYLIAAYWVHPEADYDSLADTNMLLGNPFTIKDDVHELLMFIDAVLMPGKYLTNSFIEMFMYRGS